MESAKTLFLVTLVAASLIQSYLLVNSSPNFEESIQTEFVETELTGTQSEMVALVEPQDIVLHYGDNEHVMLYPRMIFYEMIMNIVKQRSFGDLRVASDANEVWSIANQAIQGIEIRFPESLPLTVIQQAINVQGEDLANLMRIDRVYIYSRSDREEVRVFFLNTRSQMAYEAMNADLTAKDVERFVGFGEMKSRYARFDNKHYIPLEPLVMIQYEFPYRVFSGEQLQRSLFPDPYSTRNLKERDGSEIYTDGKRGLRLSANTQQMRYTNPAAPAEGSQNILDTVRSAIQFINRHGGWNGDYMLQSISNSREISGEQNITFRHYVGSYSGAYPVISLTNTIPFGDINITLRNRVITGYERSVMQLEGSAVARTQVVLMGSDNLLDLLNAYPDREQIKHVYPAYRVRHKETSIQFEPFWAVEMQDGSVRALVKGGAP
jgi:regulatory protein YycH of two-component signal transduction system YycFG